MQLTFLLITIISLTFAYADVKHLSKKYLPPSSNNFNEIEQNQKSFDEQGSAKIVNENANVDTSQSAQDPAPFPGPFIPGGNGFGFPNGGVNNFLPGQIPNFPPQANFQGFPGAAFQQGFNQVGLGPNAGFQQGFNPAGLGLNQPDLGFNQPNAAFQQGLGQIGAFGQPFAPQQFGNQGFANGFPNFPPQQFGGLNFQQPALQQPGFNFPNQFRQSDEVSTVYGSNGGYVYEKPTTKL